MKSRYSFVCACVAACMGLAQAQSEPNRTGKYRMWFTKTYGDDHLCLTEMEFFGVYQTPLNASLVSSSSCYGCATCEGCVHRYGNPLAIFDGDAQTDNAQSWFCTAPGTFTRGDGSQNVVFTLSGIPHSYVLHRPQVNGDWVSKDFSLEAEALDGTWMVIDTVVDAVKRTDQRQNISGIPQVIMPPKVPYPPWSYQESGSDWAIDYPACAGKQQSPINLDPMSESTSPIGQSKLPLQYSPMKRRALANTGKNLQIAGNFGNLTLPGGVYQANQFNFHFPAEHRIGGDDHLAIGELQMVFQKEGSRGTDDLAYVVVMLHLPLEHEILQAQEKWFINMGMLAIPEAGEYAQPLSKPIDLSILDDIFKGNFWHYTGSLTTPPCTEGVEWFVMEKPALISGVVVQQFKVKFPDPANARPVQNANGRVVSVNRLPGETAAEATE